MSGGIAEKLPVSVVIIALNEEHDIRECLESVNWAAEIIVVDALSTDRTVQICLEFTDKVMLRPWPGFAAQKKYGVEQASHEWVLSLDADERVTGDLRNEIERILGDEQALDGYYIPRKSSYLGRSIEHCGWYPGYQLRLFRKEKAVMADSRVHEGFVVDGRVDYLSSDLLHISYCTLEENLDKLNHYSRLEALQRLGRKRVRWYHFVVHPVSEFLRKFLAKGGIKDGPHGFVLSVMSAFQKMVLYMKTWQLQNEDYLRESYREAGVPVPSRFFIAE